MRNTRTSRLLTMNKTMITAVNTMSQLQRQFDVIGSNASNISTTGYKRAEVSFTDLLYQQNINMYRQNEDIGRTTPYGIRLGTGARLNQIQTVGEQGMLQRTDRELDFALTQPNQFFKVLVQDEEGNGVVHYTRNGAFDVTPTADGQLMLVTGEGYPVLDADNNTIVVPVDEMELQAGALIGIAQVNRPQFLERSGGSMFRLPEEPVVDEALVLQNLTPAEQQEAGLQQRVLESSNVNFAKEMSDLMLTQRSYQFQSQSISIADQMLGLINSVR